MSTYKSAGVDIDAGDRAVELMKASIAKATLDPRATGFGFVSLGNYLTVSGKHTVYTFVVMGGTVYYSMVSQQ